MVGDHGDQSTGRHATGAAAGWYDDPLTPGGKRYWDGSRWTEAVHGPNPAVTPGASIGGPPPAPPPNRPGLDGSLPFEPLPPGAHAVGYQGGVGVTVGDGKINDIGDWLQRTFTVVFANWLPVAILFLLPVPLWVAALLVARQTAGRLIWFVDADRLEGFSAPLLVVTVALAVVASLVSLITHLAGHHFLYGAHVGRPTTWVRSLVVGVTRQPRFLALSVLVYLVVFAALAAPVALFLYAVIGSDSPIPLVLLSLVLLLAAVGFAIWLWAKVAVFLPVTAAVVPRGTSALTAGWQLSEGRFWPMLGRLGLLWAMVGTVSTIAQVIGQTMTPTVLFSEIEITSNNRVFVNGRDIDTIDVLQISEVLPNPVLLAVYAAAILAASAVSQIISASAVSALYADAGGPNSFDHQVPG